jgi:hypothetical protein
MRDADCVHCLPEHLPAAIQRVQQPSEHANRGVARAVLDSADVVRLESSTQPQPLLSQTGVSPKLVQSPADRSRYVRIMRHDVDVLVRRLACLYTMSEYDRDR